MLEYFGNGSLAFVKIAFNSHVPKYQIFQGQLYHHYMSNTAILVDLPFQPLALRVPRDHDDERAKVYILASDANEYLYDRKIEELRLLSYTPSSQILPLYWTMRIFNNPSRRAPTPPPPCELPPMPEL